MWKPRTVVKAGAATLFMVRHVVALHQVGFAIGRFGGVSVGPVCASGFGVKKEICSYYLFRYAFAGCWLYCGNVVSPVV